jgi:hypothetical protein
LQQWVVGGKWLLLEDVGCRGIEMTVDESVVKGVVVKQATRAQLTRTEPLGICAICFAPIMPRDSGISRAWSEMAFER